MLAFYLTINMKNKDKTFIRPVQKTTLNKKTSQKNQKISMKMKQNTIV